MATPATSSYIVPKAEIKIDPCNVAGDGFEGIFTLNEAAEFTLNVETSFSEERIGGCGIATKLEIADLVDYGANLVTRDITEELLEMFHLATAATVTQSADTGLSEQFDSVIPGREYLVGVNNATGFYAGAINPIIVSVTDTVPTPYTLNDDYTVSSDGFVRLLTAAEGGTIAAGSSIIINYDIPSLTLRQTAVDANPTPKLARVWVRGCSPSLGGKIVDWFFPLMRFSPNGAFTLHNVQSGLQTASFDIAIEDAGSVPRTLAQYDIA